MHDSVISGLYAAANGRLDWQSALNHVAGALDLWAAQVLGFDKRNGQLLFSSYGGSATPQTSLDYFRHYSTIDPRVAISLATPQEQWMHCHERFSDGFVQQSAFYQNFLIPHGGRFVSATKLIDDADVQFVLAFMRGPQSQPMGQDDLPLLANFKHHFTEAFRNLVHLRETYAELGMARELLSQFAYPMLLVDDMGSIWHRNAAAQELLLRSDAVKDQNGYLTAKTLAGRDALARALHELQFSIADEEGIRRRTVTLPTADGRRLLAFLSAIRPETAMGAFGRAPRALVILHDTAKSQSLSTLNPLIVAECFDLTPAEARVAVQVAVGASLNDIAQRGRVSITTVRTQLAAIFAKVEVDRQSELVRVLLSLPVRGSS